MARNDAQNALDHDAARFGILGKIAADRFGDVEGDGRPQQLPGEKKAVDDALELAPASCEAAAEQAQDLLRKPKVGFGRALF